MKHSLVKTFIKITGPSETEDACGATIYKPELRLASALETAIKPISLLSREEDHWTNETYFIFPLQILQRCTSYLTLSIR